MGKHIKEIAIYVDTKTAITIVVLVKELPAKVEEQQDYWEDELQDMLDDYD